MSARTWPVIRWAAVVLGVSIFACAAVDQLTAGRSPPEPSSNEFDALAEQISDGSGFDAGAPPRASPSDAGTGPPEAAPPFVSAIACPRRPRRRLVGQLNLNTATIAELIRLPGIGESKAVRIVTFRSNRGPFRRIRDLRRVRGFGRKSVAKLAPHLVIAGPTTLHWEE